MFDVGWSEMVVIGVVALIAIGPKELPGVLRSVGHWVGKARRMAGEFQNQFQEAMREADIVDMKKQFDEVSSAATQMTGGNILTSIKDDVAAIRTSVSDAMVLDSPTGPMPVTPEPPTPETFVEAMQHEATAVPELPHELAPPSPSPQPDVTEAAPGAKNS